MADAEEDRGRLLMDIEKLELAKKEVEEENARVIQENRDLLEQLEGLNKSIIESDAEVKTLTTKLESTQLEVRKLNVSVSRVTQLEEQLDVIEKEQSQLQEKLILTEEDERSAIQRWRKAECTLRALQDQMEMIEHEAREEREKHVELVSRMERRRAVEKELEGAAGRLKGAAAASTIGGRNTGTNVVSHFVRDILQDNANLQSGIVELKEMLQSSNEEVQNLREQVQLHQPLASESTENESQRKTLGDELEDKSPKRVAQEFHVHHHYHTPTAMPTPKKEKMPIARRSSKKKRAMLPPGMVQAASGSRTPKTSSSRNAHRSTSSASTIISQTSVSIPPSTASHRLSSSTTVSSSTYSSMPSSPQSSHRTSSIFDRVDHGFDSSRPTSPESSVYDSPNVTSRYKKRHSGNSFRSVSSSTSDAHNSLYEHLGSDQARENAYSAKSGSGEFSIPSSLHQPIPEEQEESPSINIGDSGVEEINPPRDDDGELSSSLPFNTISHSIPERGIISVSGMDIHPLRHRPSQLLGSSAFAIRKPNRMVSPSAGLASTPPVISETNITASTISLHSSHITATSYSLLSSVAASTSIQTGTVPSSCASSTYQSFSSSSDTPRQRAQSMGQRVGGWVRGKWGTAPLSSAASSVHNLPSSASSTITANSASTNTTALIFSRPPGVNQKGPIFGFKPPPPAPSSVHPSHVDEELLQESLLE
jgi:hypothetical protein